MNRYSYEALDIQGANQLGEIESSSMSEAIQHLESRGWKVLTLRLTSAPPQEANSHEAEFLQRIQGILDRKESWEPVLEELESACLPRGARLPNQRVRRSLKNGRTVGQFLQDPYAILAIPELDGIVPSNTVRGIDLWFECVDRADRLRAKVRWGWSYPVLLLAVLFLFLSFYATYVITPFKVMYSEFGLNLPGTTKMLLAISSAFSDHFARTLTLFFCLVAGVILFTQWSLRGEWWLRWFGRIASGTNAHLHRMATMLGVLAQLHQLRAPAPLAARLAGAASGSRYLQQAMDQVATCIETGRELSTSSIVMERLPPMVLQALTARESVDPVEIRELAELYGDRLLPQRSSENNALSVLMVLGIGFIVFFIVMALFSPLISLVSNLS